MTSELVKRVRLADAVADLEQAMIEIDEAGEITDEQLARFEAGRTAVAHKVDGWILYLEGLKAMHETLKARQERARAAVKSCEHLQRRLRDYIGHMIALHPGVPFKGDDGTLYLHRSPKALKVSYEAKEGDDVRQTAIRSQTVYNVVPDELRSIEPSMAPYLKTVTFTVLDKEKLKKDIEAGMKLPWAHIEQGSHVRVR